MSVETVLQCDFRRLAAQPAANGNNKGCRREQMTEN